MSLDSLESYGDLFVNKILNILLHNKNYLGQINSGIDLKHFENEAHQWIVKEIKDYFKEYKTFPDRDWLNINLKKFSLLDPKNEPTAKLIKKTLKDIYSINTTDEDLETVSKEFVEFCRQQAFWRINEMSIELIANGQYNILLQMMKQANEIGLPTMGGHDLHKDFNDLYDEEIRNVIPLPTPEFNDWYEDKGISRGSVVTMIAPAGTGKSWWGVDWGSSVLKMGMNVLYFNLESKHQKVAKRFHARISDTNIDDFNQNREKFQECLDSLEGRLIIKDLTSKNKTVDFMRSYIDYLGEHENFKPDLIIIDYVGLLNKGSKNDINSSDVQNWVDVTDIARSYDCVVYSPSKVDRTGINDEIITEDKVGGTITVIYGCDLILSLSKSGIVHNIKNKDGKGTGKSYQFDVDTNCGKFLYVDEYFPETNSKRKGSGFKTNADKYPSK